MISIFHLCVFILLVMLVIYLQFILLGIIFYLVKWAQFLLNVLFDIICIFNRKQKFYYQEVGKIKYHISNGFSSREICSSVSPSLLLPQVILKPQLNCLGKVALFSIRTQ